MTEKMLTGMLEFNQTNQLPINELPCDFVDMVVRNCHNFYELRKQRFLVICIFSEISNALPFNLCHLSFVKILLVLFSQQQKSSHYQALVITVD